MRFLRSASGWSSASSPSGSGRRGACFGFGPPFAFAFAAGFFAVLASSSDASSAGAALALVGAAFFAAVFAGAVLAVVDLAVVFLAAGFVALSASSDSAALTGFLRVVGFVALAVAVVRLTVSAAAATADDDGISTSTPAPASARSTAFNRLASPTPAVSQAVRNDDASIRPSSLPRRSRP